VTKKNASKRKSERPLTAPVDPPELTESDVLGDMIDSSFDIEVEDDGNVRLHARCGKGDDPAACARKVRFLVEALGAEMVAPPELPR
jgi:hypothetical protein